MTDTVNVLCLCRCYYLIKIVVVIIVSMCAGANDDMNMVVSWLVCVSG